MIKGKDKKNYGETAWETKRLVNATLFLALLTFLVAGVGVYQACLTTTALINADSTSAQQIRIMYSQLQASREGIRRQDSATHRQDTAAWSQIDIARETMQTELRAFIHLVPRPIGIKGNDTLETQWLLENRGKTPANNVVWWGLISIDPYNKTNFERKSKISKINPILQSSFGGVGNEEIMSFNVNGEVLTVAKRDGFFLWGEVLYEDIFGVKHSTGFRIQYFWDGTKFSLFRWCQDGNYTN